ncbi:unnamed protein product [Caenorhabditis sp. 36 PRJEB53466]|nr:unnamed protein product [Caenorhabditis sp. 36 PRJEB53466]
MLGQSQNVTSTTTIMPSNYQCTPEEESQNYEAVEQMFATLYFVLPFSAFGALSANLIYLIVVTVGIRKGKLPLKRYALTINRTCADIFTIIVGAYFYTKQKMERCDSHICLPTETDPSKYVLQVVFILNYWCVSLSYTGIAVLTNYAVRAPLQISTYGKVEQATKGHGFLLFGLHSFAVFSTPPSAHDGKLKKHLPLDDWH